MVRFIQSFKKKFPRIYNYLKTSNFVNNFVSRITILITIIKKDRGYTWFYLKTTFQYYILKNKSDIEFTYHEYKLYMPRHLKGIEWFIEVEIDWFYDKLQWFCNVLDLWWYIWDSALRLAKNNKQVTVYEAHPGNYKYLKLNTQNVKNIESYNFAVVGSDIKYLNFDWWDFNEWAKISNTNNSIKVRCKNIIDILKEKDFDCLKMDIEWSEYECFDTIIKNPEYFKFNHWFIEFHFWDMEPNLMKKVCDISERLKACGFNIKIYSVLPEYREIDSLNDLKIWVCLVYFYV